MTIKAAVFDAYGTLFDVHAPVMRVAQQLGASAPALSALWRTKQLEYSWVLTLMGQHRDFWQLTGDALEFAMAALGIRNAALARDLLQAYGRLDAFAEVPALLNRLREKGIRCAILSNGTSQMLAQAVQAAGLEGHFDAVLSAEAVSVFKTDRRIYQLALDHFKLAPGEIGFCSSNAWDAAGAASFGFNVVWINRGGQPVEYGLDKNARILSDLARLHEVI